ncbi:MAG: chemotaxis protein CheW [Calditrichaeota bacterium]|nr:MAG: chemotaxis protein CheW [Calditrichota bacterium]
MKEGGSKSRNLFVHARIGSRVNVALPMEFCQEILSWQNPFSLPIQNPMLLGVIHLRGEIMPILELAGLLNLPSQWEERKHRYQKRKIVVVRQESHLFGLTVDAVPAILDAQNRRLFKKLDAHCPLSPSMVRGYLKINKQEIYLLNLPALLQQAILEVGGCRMAG